MNRIVPALLLVAILIAGCSLVLRSREGVPADGDADVDVDADVDGDSDSDSDSDSGGDGDVDDGGDVDVDGPCRLEPESVGVTVVVEVPTLRVDLGGSGFRAEDIACTARPDATVIASVNFDDGTIPFDSSGDMRIESGADADGGTGEAGLSLCAADASATLHSSIAGIGSDLLDVAFYARNSNLGNGQFLRAEFSTDGTTFDLFAFVGDEILRGAEWQYFDTVLSPAVSGHDELWLRFTRVGGTGPEDCAAIDDLRIMARGYSIEGGAIISEDFEDGYGGLERTAPLFDSDIVPSPEGGYAVEMVCSSDATIWDTFFEPELGDSGRIALTWRWQEITVDELIVGKYVLAEYSDDGSTWRQMAAIGLGVAPSSMMPLGTLLPNHLTDDVFYRFTSPSTNDNSPIEGALIDDIHAIHIDLQPEGVLAPLVDVGGGVFESSISAVLAGQWSFQCTWTCGTTEVRSTRVRQSF